MVQLDFQRLIDQGLILLAEHLNAYSNGTKSPPDVLSELRLAKDVVHCLVDGDQVTNIDQHLEVLCHSTRLAAHRIGRSVLDDFRDREDFNEDEIFAAMADNLVRMYETVDEDDCICVRARALIRDTQVHSQSGTAFNFRTRIVPSSNSNPKDITFTANLSVADEVRLKLLLHIYEARQTRGK